MKGAVVSMSKHVTKMGLWLALVSVLSIISFPIGPVPITLQVFAFFLMAAFLNPIEAVEVSIGYLLLGAVGIPIFAGFTSGIATLVGPTGGYLWGFIPAAWIASTAWRKRGVKRVILLSLSLLSIYIPGALLLSVYTNGIVNAIRLGVIPFIWIDAIKIAFIFPISHKISNLCLTK